jgi:hypothetical protein
MKCHNEILKKLIDKYPNLKMEAKTDKDSVNSHLSISHKQNNHTLWILIYDKTGIFFTESKGKIVKQDNNRVIKYTGTTPTLNEIKKVLE